MKYLYLIILFLSATISFSQDYIPTVVEGKLYTIEQGIGMGGYLYYKYFVVCDTSIGDYDYKKLISTSNADYGYVREDIETQEVFLREVGDEEERLYISYNLKQGDSFTLWGHDQIVDSVYHQTLYGRERKIIDFGFGGRYIEGVGHSYYGVGFFGGTNGHIIDYLEDVKICGDVINSNEEIHDIDSGFKLYPNPVINELRIELNSSAFKSIKLYDSKGKLISGYKIKGDLTISLAHLNQGVYYIIDDLGNATKFLKI